MTVSPLASRRWLAGAGLAAAAGVGVAGCGGSSPVDAPPALAPVVLATSAGTGTPARAVPPPPVSVAAAELLPDRTAGQVPQEHPSEEPAADGVADPYVYRAAAATGALRADAGQTAADPGAATSAGSDTVAPAGSDTVPPASPVGRNPFLPLTAAHDDVALSRLLVTGDRGEDVRWVQQALVDRFWGLVVDGVYGARTTAAVAGFQSEHGLAVDGVVGPVTWGALSEAEAG